MLIIIAVIIFLCGVAAATIGIYGILNLTFGEDYANTAPGIAIAVFICVSFVFQIWPIMFLAAITSVLTHFLLAPRFFKSIQ